MSASGHSTGPPGFQFVVVVASLGGLPVLATLLGGLPGTFPVPVLVVSHRPCSEHDTLAALLAKQASLPVRTATAGLATWGPGVTVIPGGTSATISQGRQLGLRPVAGRRDLCGDTLLASTAEAARPGHVIAVVLSGMLHDGTEGIRAVTRHGGRVMAPDTTTTRDNNLPSRATAPALTALTMAPGGADLLAVPAPHWAGLGAR